MDIESIMQIADDQENFLDRMVARHRARITRSINKLERRIVDRLSAISATGGRLEGPKVNLAQAQKVHTDMTKLFEEEYGEPVRTIVDEYAESLRRIQYQYRRMGEAVSFTGADKTMFDMLKKQDLSMYAQFGQQAQDRIATAMYDHIVAQSPFSDLVAAIAGVLVGHEDARGRPMTMYAEQMANDGIMNFHNAVNMKKATDLGFDAFLYSGNIIRDSRPFCIERAGKVFTEEEINSWTFPWKGKAGPAMVKRGGYNCRHHWQPVRSNWIPEGEIEVESWFDRAATPDIAELPEDVKISNKFIVFREWKRSVLIDKKPLSAQQLFDKLGLSEKVQKSTVSSWLSQWSKGNNLPKDWQSIIKEIEDELGSVIIQPPKPPLLPPVTPPVGIQPKPLAGGSLEVLTDLSNKQNAFRLWKGNQLTAQEISERLGGAVKDTTIRGWLGEWKAGRNLPKDWEKIVTDLGGTLTSSPAVDAVRDAAAQAAQAASWDAVKDAKAVYSSTLNEFQNVQRQLYGTDPIPTLSGSGFQGVEINPQGYTAKSLAQRSYNAKFKTNLDAYDTKVVEYLKNEIAPLITQHNDFLNKLRQETITILELDEATVPVAFKQITSASQAKSFYADAQARTKLFKKTFEDMGARMGKSYWGGEYENAFSYGIGTVDPNTFAGLLDKKYAEKLFEHLKVEKRARYQWLKLADESTYKEEVYKVLDSLVSIKAKGNAAWKSASAKKEILLQKKLRTRTALEWVPIDLLDSMKEAGYSIEFLGKAGRSYYNGRVCTIFETYKAGGEVSWDVISHEWGHAIDGFLNGRGTTGGNWGGLSRAENFVSKADGDNYRAWFAKQHGPTKGKYSNGDGYYWEDNWIDDYEGRIYQHGGDGEEWMSMNVQRYSYSRWKQAGSPKFQGLGGNSWHITKTSIGNDTWEQAKIRYPELTTFMEKLFSNRTALY